MHTHVPTDESYEIPTEFDPNLALAIIWGENLEQAKERGMQFLDELTLQGENQSGELKSNVNFLRPIRAAFSASSGLLDTAWISKKSTSSERTPQLYPGYL